MVAALDHLEWNPQRSSVRGSYHFRAVLIGRELCG